MAPLPDHSLPVFHIYDLESPLAHRNHDEAVFDAGPIPYLHGRQRLAIPGKLRQRLRGIEESGRRVGFDAYDIGTDDHPVALLPLPQILLGVRRWGGDDTTFTKAELQAEAFLKDLLDNPSALLRRSASRRYLRLTTQQKLAFAKPDLQDLCL